MKKLILTLTVLFLLMPQTGYAMHGLGGSVYADVNGLVCDFCARALEKVFSKQEAVSDINVNLDTKVITINFKDGQTLEDDKIKELINDSGYDVKAIRHNKATPQEPNHE